VTLFSWSHNPLALNKPSICFSKHWYLIYQLKLCNTPEDISFSNTPGRTSNISTSFFIIIIFVDLGGSLQVHKNQPLHPVPNWTTPGHTLKPCLTLTVTLSTMLCLDVWTSFLPCSFQLKFCMNFSFPTCTCFIPSTATWQFVIMRYYYSTFLQWKLRNEDIHQVLYSNRLDCILVFMWLVMCMST
jgi:hypothetical protein